MRHLRQLPPCSESHRSRSSVQLFQVATARAIDETIELDTVYNSVCSRCAQPLCVIISKLVDAFEFRFHECALYNSRMSNSDITSKFFLPRNNCNIHSSLAVRMDKKWVWPSKNFCMHCVYCLLSKKNPSYAPELAMLH